MKQALSTDKSYISPVTTIAAKIRQSVFAHNAGLWKEKPPETSLVLILENSPNKKIRYLLFSVTIVQSQALRVSPRLYFQTECSEQILGLTKG